MSERKHRMDILIFDTKAGIVSCVKCRLRELSVMPENIHPDVSTSQQSADGSLLPIVRQSGKQPDAVVMGLHQHFSDTCCDAEIAVNLKRRMGVEQIRIGTAAALIRNSAGTDSAKLILQQP